jgi:hypothetical protein
LRGNNGLPELQNLPGLADTAPDRLSVRFLSAPAAALGPGCAVLAFVVVTLFAPERNGGLFDRWPGIGRRSRRTTVFGDLTATENLALAPRASLGPWAVLFRVSGPAGRARVQAAAAEAGPVPEPARRAGVSGQVQSLWLKTGMPLAQEPRGPAQAMAKAGPAAVPQGRTGVPLPALRENPATGVSLLPGSEHRVPGGIHDLLPALHDKGHRRGGDPTGGQLPQPATARADHEAPCPADGRADRGHSAEYHPADRAGDRLSEIQGEHRHRAGRAAFRLRHRTGRCVLRAAAGGVVPAARRDAATNDQMRAGPSN